ncbi:hypothetical protein FGG08_001437 [Glutinoglossum americanum]|uniref:DNA-directed RNA polymerase I subunit rpa49 n=1 Tax=Glutinoglossum americanum TaxID=1670608 RepID=A0A9P8I225_9PEZI|nr:hypothetical protein FGG08_001437 [Glutinoglossum americanum]
MAELKRKREPGKNGRASKRVAVGAPKPVPVVQVSMIQDMDEWCPVIASTPGLALPKTTCFEPFRRPYINNQVRRKSSTSANSELLLNSSAHPKIDYTGREETAEDRLLKHYVGVYDPAIGELQVMEARKLIIRGALRKEATPDKELEEEEKQTNRALRDELGLAFGTKKTRKAIASLTENAISPSKSTVLRTSSDTNAPLAIDSVATAVLESIAPSVNTMASRDDLQKDIDANKPRPKANLHATSPDEVYSVESLVGHEEMRILSVKEWQDAMAEGDGITSKSRYICKKVQRVGEAGDVKRLKVLRYLQLLLDFFFSLGKGSRDGRKLPPREELKKALGVPDFLVDRVRGKFTNGGLPMTKWHVDNLITHIAAIALIVDGFEVDIYDLKEDLKLETKEITQYFQEIGCKVQLPTEKERERMKLTKAEATLHKLAKLRIPLEFPKTRQIRTKR